MAGPPPGAGGYPPGGPPPGAPSEEELRAAYEAELSRITAVDMIAQAAVSLLNIGARRLGPPPGAELPPGSAPDGGRDLEQAGDAIDGARALLSILERRISARELGPLKEALSQLQMAYAREIQARGGAGAAAAGADEGAGDGSGAPDGGEDPGDGPGSGRGGPGPGGPGAGGPGPGGGSGAGPGGPGSAPAGEPAPGARPGEQPGPAERSGRLWVPGR